VREREVLAHAAQGLSNCEIAETLVIAETTVQNHLRSAYEKLGATSRIQAGLKANLLVYIGHTRSNSDTRGEKPADVPPHHLSSDPLSENSRLRTGGKHERTDVPKIVKINQDKHPAQEYTGNQTQIEGGDEGSTNMKEQLQEW
jgi:DNA-binding CsgD family transcriptional regulator